MAQKSEGIAGELRELIEIFSVMSPDMLSAALAEEASESQRLANINTIKSHIQAAELYVEGQLVAIKKCRPLLPRIYFDLLKLDICEPK